MKKSINICNSFLVVRFTLKDDLNNYFPLAESSNIIPYIYFENNTEKFIINNQSVTCCDLVSVFVNFVWEEGYIMSQVDNLYFHFNL